MVMHHWSFIFICDIEEMPNYVFVCLFVCFCFFYLINKVFFYLVGATPATAAGALNNKSLVFSLLHMG